MNNIDKSRNRLIELLKNQNCPSPMICSPDCKYANLKSCFEARIADFLLANGVIVTDCVVGDTLWFETWTKNATVCEGIQPHKVDRIDITYVCDTDKLIETKIPHWELGKRVFTAKESCEEAFTKVSE